MSKRPVQQQFVRVLALSLLIALVGGSLALLNQWHQVVIPGHAASDESVVGPPSLSAATVDKIFRQLGSPMVGDGQAVEAASQAANIDDAFALAAWWVETNDGAAGVGLADRNPGSVRGSIGYPSAYDGYTIYPTYTAAVDYWFPMLQKGYIERGLTTVYAISHPYVGTSSSNLWAGKVVALMQLYRNEAPAPQPTATTTPVATPTLSAEMIRQQVLQTRRDRQETPDKPGVVPVVVAPSAAGHTVRQPQAAAPTPASDLSPRIKWMLVLFNLLLALALSVWAESLKWRYPRRAQPVVAQPTSNVWEQLRISQLKPAAFLDQRALNGLLPTTAGLSFNMSATHAPGVREQATNLANPDTLWVLNTLQPTYNTSGAMPALGRSTLNRFPQTPLPASAFSETEQFSFSMPLPTFSGQSPFETPAALFIGKPPLNGPIPVFTGPGNLSGHGSVNPTARPPFNAPATRYIQQPAPQPGSALDLPHRSVPPTMPALSPLRRTRLQPQSVDPSQNWPPIEQRSQQPAPASLNGERSTGLLSRYREAQNG